MSNPTSGTLAEALALIGEALRDLRYGEVVIQVHNGQIVQIDRTDKLRPQPPPVVARKS